jgi:hypothetical protein
MANSRSVQKRERTDLEQITVLRFWRQMAQASLRPQAEWSHLTSNSGC